MHIAYPTPESRQRCGERGNAEGDAFHRRIAPRFVVGGEHRDIESDQQVVVGKVEHSVFAVQVAGKENHLHLVFGAVLQARQPDAVQNGVGVGIIQVMRAELRP